MGPVEFHKFLAMLKEEGFTISPDLTKLEVQIVDPDSGLHTVMYLLDAKFSPEMAFDSALALLGRKGGSNGESVDRRIYSGSSAEERKFHDLERRVFDALDDGLAAFRWEVLREIPTSDPAMGKRLDAMVSVVENVVANELVDLAARVTHLEQSTEERLRMIEALLIRRMRK